MPLAMEGNNEERSGRKKYLGQFHFSISHSGSFAAAIVSKQERVGIDIELYSPKTELIKHKFLTDAELTLLTTPLSSDNHQLPTPHLQFFTLCWCCKESVYKHWGNGGIDFRKHICIEGINPAIHQINVLFTKQTAHLEVHYSLLDTLCLAWVIS